MGEVARSGTWPVAMLSRCWSISARGGDPGADEPVADLLDGGAFECRARRRGDREVGVGGDVDQSVLAQQPGQGAAVGEVGVAAGHQRAEAVAEPVRQVLRRAVVVGAEERLQAGVGVLDQDPATGTQRGDHRRERGLASRDVRQHQAGVHEVQIGGGRILDADVVAQDPHGAPGRGRPATRCRCRWPAPDRWGRPGPPATAGRTCRRRRPPSTASRSRRRSRADGGRSSGRTGWPAPRTAYRPGSAGWPAGSPRLRPRAQCAGMARGPRTRRRPSGRRRRWSGRPARRLRLTAAAGRRTATRGDRRPGSPVHLER